MHSRGIGRQQVAEDVVLLAGDGPHGIGEDEVIERRANGEPHEALGVANVVHCGERAVVRSAHAIGALRPHIEWGGHGILPRVVRRDREIGVCVRAGDAHFGARRIGAQSRQANVGVAVQRLRENLLERQRGARVNLRSEWLRNEGEQRDECAELADETHPASISGPAVKRPDRKRGKASRRC